MIFITLFDITLSEKRNRFLLLLHYFIVVVISVSDKIPYYTQFNNLKILFYF